jgi:hypothetical protein
MSDAQTAKLCQNCRFGMDLPERVVTSSWPSEAPAGGGNWRPGNIRMTQRAPGILCQRFPQAVEKWRDDWCGEFAGFCAGNCADEKNEAAK